MYTNDIELSAIALRTHLAVYESTERWSSAVWASGADTTRRFRVCSDVPDLVAVDVQISTERFPVEGLMDDTFCDPPAGAQTQVMEVPPGGRELNIDISVRLDEPAERRHLGAGASVAHPHGRARLHAGDPATSAGNRCRVAEFGALGGLHLPGPWASPLLARIGS